MVDNNNTGRVRRLFEQVPTEVDSVVLSPGETLRYFTGLNMHKSERPTLIVLSRDADPAVLLPRLERDRVEESLPDADFFPYQDATDPVAAGREAFEELTAARELGDPIGAEFRSTRLLETTVFAPGDTEVVDVEDAVSTVRARKDTGEIEKMRTAAEIIESILADVYNEIKPGMTELDVEREIRKGEIDSEADDLGVVVVTAGDHTAHAHTNTSNRVIKDGDPVMIDAGVVYEGYYSDITRTLAVGDPGTEFEEIYEVVKRAAAAAREEVAPGVEMQAIDRAAREVIEEAGYGEYFPHRVGHGLGLEGHEPPYLVEGNDAELEVGHAVTVEPGVYVPGLGGVRIEDDVIVSEDGAEVLTTSSRELRQV